MIKSFDLKKLLNLFIRILAPRLFLVSNNKDLCCKRFNEGLLTAKKQIYIFKKAQIIISNNQLHYISVMDNC